jgi:hypothetical protein
VTLDDPRHAEVPGEVQLTPSQSKLLQDFSRKARRPDLNRPFTVSGRPPQRRLVREDLVIEANISDDDLLSLARAGYLTYMAQQQTVAFRDSAYDGRAHREAMPAYHFGTDGIKLRRIGFTFGKYPAITVVRSVLLLVAIVLTVLYAAGILSTSTIQTWVAIAALVAVVLALQVPQRERR